MIELLFSTTEFLAQAAPASAPVAAPSGLPWWLLLYKPMLFVHLLAMAVWVGGSVMLAVSIISVLRDPQFKDKLPQLIGLLGRRASLVGWVALILLVVTGWMLMLVRGGGSLFSVNLWFSGAWTVALLHKLAIVTLILGLAAWHDFYAGPRAIAQWEKSPDAPETARARKVSSLVGRINLGLSLIVVFLGISLARGCG